MIGRRMANIIKRFARHRDDMRLANFQRVRGLDAEWKFLRCPTEYCLPNLTLVVRARRALRLILSFRTISHSSAQAKLGIWVARREKILVRWLV